LSQSNQVVTIETDQGITGIGEGGAPDTVRPLAGLLIGEVVSLTTFFAPKLSDIAVFGVMALVLLLRPSGLFGEAGLME